MGRQNKTESKQKQTKSTQRTLRAIFHRTDQKTGYYHINTNKNTYNKAKVMEFLPDEYF